MKETTSKKSDCLGRLLSVGDIVVFCVSRGGKSVRGRVMVGRITRFGKSNAFVRYLTKSAGLYKISDHDTNVLGDDQLFKLEQSAAAALPREAFELLDAMELTGKIEDYTHEQASRYITEKIFASSYGASRGIVTKSFLSVDSNVDDLLRLSKKFNVYGTQGFYESLKQVLKREHLNGVPREKLQHFMRKFQTGRPWLTTHPPAEFAETAKFVLDWINSRM